MDHKGKAKLPTLLLYRMLSQVAQVVKNPPANARDASRRFRFGFWVRKISWRGNGNCSSILARKIPQTKEADGPQSLESQRTGHTHTVGIDGGYGRVRGKHRPMDWGKGRGHGPRSRARG